MSDIVRYPPGWLPLESYNLNFKQKSSDACPMCANISRAPADANVGRCHLRSLTLPKCRTGAVEF